MEKEELRKLGVIIALQEYCDAIIENAKEKMRKMTKEEVNKINESIFLEVSRKNNVKISYPKEYKDMEKIFKEELQKKYPPTVETRENYTITCKSTSYSRSKAEIVVNDILTQNKTTLQEMAKVAKQ